MKIFRFLSFLFIVFSVHFASSAQTGARLGATWQVMKYDLAVTLPAVETSREMTVRAKLDMKNVSAIGRFTQIRISPRNGFRSESNGTMAILQRPGRHLQRSQFAYIVPRGNLSAVIESKIAVKKLGFENASAAGYSFYQRLLYRRRKWDCARVRNARFEVR